MKLHVKLTELFKELTFQCYLVLKQDSNGKKVHSSFCFVPDYAKHKIFIHS